MKITKTSTDREGINYSIILGYHRAKRKNYCYTLLHRYSSYIMLNENSSCGNIYTRSTNYIHCILTHMHVMLSRKPSMGMTHAHFRMMVLCIRKMGKCQLGGYTGSIKYDTRAIFYFI